jgi:hypothetical protein
MQVRGTADGGGDWLGVSTRTQVACARTVSKDRGPQTERPLQRRAIQDRGTRNWVMT